MPTNPISNPRIPIAERPKRKIGSTSATAFHVVWLITDHCMLCRDVAARLKTSDRSIHRAVRYLRQNGIRVRGSTGAGGGILI